MFLNKTPREFLWVVFFGQLSKTRIFNPPPTCRCWIVELYCNAWSICLNWQRYVANSFKKLTQAMDCVLYNHRTTLGLSWQNYDASKLVACLHSAWAWTQVYCQLPQRKGTNWHRHMLHLKLLTPNVLEKHHVALLVNDVSLDPRVVQQLLEDSSSGGRTACIFVDERLPAIPSETAFHIFSF